VHPQASPRISILLKLQLLLKINPKRSNLFVHLSSSWSHPGGRNLPTASLFMGKKWESSSRLDNSFFVKLFLAIHAHASWTNSAPSSATPIATTIVEPVTNFETWSFHASREALIPHAIGDGESVSKRLDRGLVCVAAGAIIFYALLILECTIGIIRTIKNLLNM
jgi:hypothetical protein